MPAGTPGFRRVLVRPSQVRVRTDRWHCELWPYRLGKGGGEMIGLMKGLIAMSVLMMSQAAVATEPKPKTAPTRDQITERDKWNLTDIFANDAAFEAAFKQVEGLIGGLGSLKGTLGRSPESLLAALKMRDDTMSQLEKVILYAGLSYHQDMSVGETQGRFDRVQSLGNKAGEAVSWFVPEVLNIPVETVRSWLWPAEAK